MSAQLYDRKEYNAGEMIFAQGDEGLHIYIVESGKVAIRRNVNGRNTVLAECGPGKLFGEMALLDNGPRSADAIALESTTCTRIPALIVQEQLERCPPFIALLLKILVRNMRISDTGSREDGQEQVPDVGEDPVGVVAAQGGDEGIPEMQAAEPDKDV